MICRAETPSPPAQMPIHRDPWLFAAAVAKRPPFAAHHPSPPQAPVGGTPSLRRRQSGHIQIDSAGTMEMLSTPTRALGLLISPPLFWVTGVSPMVPSTSSPRIRRPNAVYCRSRNFASPRQMKNWLPAELGSCERAIETTPRTCDWSLNSDVI